MGFDSLLNLFLTSPCPLCQHPANDVLCDRCYQRLKQYRYTSRQKRQDALPVFAWGIYDGTLKNAIAAMKYKNHPELARPLGQWLGEAWLKSQRNAQVTVVPIPLHAARLEKRGFNQAELLAQHFCKVTGLPLQRNGLQRVRETEAQFSLSRAERKRNLAGAFTVQKGFSPHERRVLLLDDIYTTGATLSAAAHALRSAGISVCGAVTIANVILKK